MSKRNKITLIHPLKQTKREMKKTFKYITCLYETDYKQAQKHIQMLLDYLQEYINQPQYWQYTLANTIKFYPTKQHMKDKNYFELPIIEFTYMLIMGAPLLGMGIEMTEDKIFNPGIAVGGTLTSYLDTILRKYKHNVTFMQYCEFISDWIHNIDKLCANVGNKLGLSLDHNDYTELMRRYDEIREIITVSNFPKNLTPRQLEQESWARIDRFSDIASKEKDLHISTYINTGLLNRGQSKEYSAHLTFKPSADGHTVAMTDNTNLLMGINSPEAQTVDGNGGRKAEILKINVADAGAFEYNISVLLSDIIHVDTEYTCGSNHLRKRFIADTKSLSDLEGRAYSLNKISNEFDIITIDSTDLIGKTVYIKTPVTCTHPWADQGYVCRGCYGELLSIINQHTHVGKNTGFCITSEFQQKLLSAKHLNTTDTYEIVFNSDFGTYFTQETNSIRFHPDISNIADSIEDVERYQSIYIEFNELTMDKKKDGEGRHYDRCVPEIVIYDERTDERTIIKEENKGIVYLSPTLVEFYLDALHEKEIHADLAEELGDLVRIPLVYLIESMTDDDDVLFEVPYFNKELNEVLKKAMSAIETKRIEDFKSYDHICDELRILYDLSGLDISDIHIEILVSKLIHSPDNNPLDWTQDEVDYEFRTVDASIKSKPSALTAAMHGDTVRQLRGNAIYEKSAPGPYDAFISRL